MKSFLRDVGQRRHNWLDLDLRFEDHGDELAFKQTLVEIRPYATLASCLGLYGSLAASQVVWFLSEHETRDLSSGEMAHCVAVLVATGLALPTSLLSLHLVQCSGQGYHVMRARFWEPFWSLLSVALLILLATRWHMVPDSGPSTSMLTSLAVVVFLAGLPLRLWLALFLSFAAVTACLVSTVLQASYAGTFDTLVAGCGALLLVKTFWVNEKHQRLTCLQESIQILQPVKAPSTAWSAVGPTSSDKPGDDLCRRSLSGARRQRSWQEPNVVLLRCKADLRIEETTLGENAFFGEDVAGKELLSLFRPGERKALSAAMAEATAVDSAVALEAEVGQGRHACFVRIFPSGMCEEKWLALFCKDYHMLKNPPLQKDQKKSQENAMTQTNPLDLDLTLEVPLGQSRVRHRNGTWTDGEVDFTQNSVEQAVQMLRRGFSCVAIGAGQPPGHMDAEERARSRNSTKQSLGQIFHSLEEQASMGSKNLKNWQLSSGEQEHAQAAQAVSSFSLAEPSLMGGMMVHQVTQAGDPGRSTSFPGPLPRRRSISSPRMGGDLRDSRGITLSYSLSVSQASCSHTISSASKATRKEDASIQTDLVWMSQGWHCRACSKPPKPGGAPSRLPGERRRLPPYHAVASIQGSWRLVDGPEGVSEWLREFVISGTTVHSKSHHFPLLEGAFGIEMAGGALELRADGSLIRHGKSGHSFIFRRGRVDIDYVEAPLRHVDSDRDTGDQEDPDGLSRAMSFVSNAGSWAGSVRIGSRRESHDA